MHATTVTTSNLHNASFTYDGDGRRVIATEAGTTTIFIGNHFEWKNSAMTKYYYAGGMRLAVRNGNTSGTSQLSYLLTDHLGSTRLTYRADLATSELASYSVWGVASGAFTNTRYTYTGQYSYTGSFGLMYYNARWYDPALNRFAQPDSIVPNPGNPMDFDRYAYVRNNPLKYNDPSGHRTCSAQQATTGDETCDQNYVIGELIDYLELTFNWRIVTPKEWNYSDLMKVYLVGKDVRNFIEQNSHLYGDEWIRENLHGSLRLLSGNSRSYVLGNTMFLNPTNPKHFIAHELGHFLDNLSSGNRICYATFCGGGVGEDLITILGGTTGISTYFDDGPSTIPPQYKFSLNVNFDVATQDAYGNGSTTEFFAEVFSWAIYDVSKIHPNVYYGLLSVIGLVYPFSR